MFKGYMRLYLNADTMEEMLAKSQFHGDWATKRYQIMKKPRHYFVNLYTRAMDMLWDVRIWTPMTRYHPNCVLTCNKGVPGEQLHIKYDTKRKVNSTELWESMRDAIWILLDTSNEDYIVELTKAMVELMGDTLKTHVIIADEIAKLPTGFLVIDMDETYATIRC